MTETYIFSQALREFFRVRRLLPWILLMGLTFLLGYSWRTLAPGSAAVDQYSQVSSMLVFRILALASIIYTTAIVSQEVEQKTIVYLLTRPVARWKLLLARYAASVVVVSMLGVTSAIALSLAVYGPGGAFSNPLLAKDILALVLGAFGYGAVFLFVSLIANRAILICLLFAGAWEPAVPNMPGDLYRLTIFSHLQAIAEHPVITTRSDNLKGAISLLSGALGTNTLSFGTAVTTLVLLTLFGVALSATWFSKFEYVPREDAE